MRSGAVVQNQLSRLLPDGGGVRAFRCAHPAPRFLSCGSCRASEGPNRNGDLCLKQDIDGWSFEAAAELLSLAALEAAISDPNALDNKRPKFPKS